MFSRLSFEHTFEKIEANFFQHFSNGSLQKSYFIENKIFFGYLHKISRFMSTLKINHLQILESESELQTRPGSDCDLRSLKFKLQLVFLFFIYIKVLFYTKPFRNILAMFQLEPFGSARFNSFENPRFIWLTNELK